MKVTPLPPGPIDIGNSLRFRNSQRLTSNSAVRPPGNFTLSAWMKCAWTETTDNNSIYGNNDSTRGYKISNPNSGTPYRLSSRDGTSLLYFSDAENDDPSAWFNFVIQNQGEQSTAYINGVRQTNTITTFPAQGQIVIGSGNPGNQDESLNAYLADFYVIDGQVLPPTAFGKYDDNNKWIPIEYEGNYGNNGFHLTFQPDTITQNSDGTITVADTSGLGNNFTGTGFDVTLYATGDYNHDSNAFDTNTNTVPTTNGGAAYWIDIVPDTGSTDWTYGPPQGWSKGNVSGTGTDGSTATYMYGGITGTGLVQSLNFDLRDFPTVNSVSIYAGWNQAGDNQGGAVFQLLDADKNVIPNTQQYPIRIGNSSQKYTLCTSDVGARYINFDASNC